MASRRQPSRPLPFRGVQSRAARPVSPFAPSSPNVVNQGTELDGFLSAIAKLSPAMQRITEREHGKFLDTTEKEAEQLVLDAERNGNAKSFADFEKQNPEYLGASPWRGVFVASAFGRRRAIDLQRRVTSPEFLSQLANPGDPTAWEDAVNAAIAEDTSEMSFYERSSYEKMVQERVVPEGRRRADAMRRTRSVEQSHDDLGAAVDAFLEEAVLGDPSEATLVSLGETMAEYHTVNQSRGAEVIEAALKRRINVQAQTLAAEGKTADEIHASLKGMVLDLGEVTDSTGSRLWSNMEPELDAVAASTLSISRNAASLAQESNNRALVATRDKGRGIMDKHLLAYRDGDSSFEEARAAMAEELQELDWPEGRAEEEVASFALRMLDKRELSFEEYVAGLESIDAGTMEDGAFFSLMAAEGLSSEQKSALINRRFAQGDKEYQEYKASYTVDLDASLKRKREELLSQGYEVVSVEEAISTIRRGVKAAAFDAAALPEADRSRTALLAAVAKIDEDVQSHLGYIELKRFSPVEFVDAISANRAHPILKAGVDRAVDRRVSELTDPNMDAGQVAAMASRVRSSAYSAIEDALMDAEEGANWLDVTRGAIKDWRTEEPEPTPEQTPVSQLDEVQVATAATETNRSPLGQLNARLGVDASVSGLVKDFGIEKVYYEMPKELTAVGIQHPSQLADEIKRLEANNTPNNSRLARKYRGHQEAFIEWRRAADAGYQGVLDAVDAIESNPYTERSNIYRYGADSFFVHRGQFAILDAHGNVVQNSFTEAMTERFLFAKTRYGGVSVEELQAGGFMVDQYPTHGVDHGDFQNGAIAVGPSWFDPRRSLYVTTLADFDKKTQSDWEEISSGWKNLEAGETLTWEQVRDAQYSLLQTYAHDLPGLNDD